MLRSTTPATSGELFRPGGDVLSSILESPGVTPPKVAKAAREACGAGHVPNMGR
ncbi:MAG TPA: hypothetical protein VGR09_00205 [Gemmatimonadales bacterium]|nr:hypothetical protein [Gemmatimonadales bacterium]